MESYNAEITIDEDEYYLTLNLQEKNYRISITKDVPKDVQGVFNELIIELKNGLFQFSMSDVEDGDIFYHVAKEYIVHLNSEIKDIYSEMKEQGLLLVEVVSISQDDLEAKGLNSDQAEAS